MDGDKKNMSSAKKKATFLTDVSGDARNYGNFLLVNT